MQSFHMCYSLTYFFDCLVLLIFWKRHWDIIGMKWAICVIGYNLVSFTLGVQPENHPHTQDDKHFHHLAPKFPCTFLSFLPPSPCCLRPQPQVATDLPSVTIDYFSLFRISYKWNHSMHSFLSDFFHSA